MIKVLLADDHEIVRQGVSAILGFEPDIEIAGRAGGGAEALELVRKLSPDILVTDIEMPGYSEIRLCNEIRVLGLSTKCIVLSMHSSEDYVHSAFRAGAHVYVAKERSVDFLAQATRSVVNLRRYVSPNRPIPLSRILEPG